MFKFNPTTGELDLVTSDPFITDGHDGITTIRMQSTPGGIIYDVTVDDTGHLVTTIAAGEAGSPIGLLLALTYD